MKKCDKQAVLFGLQFHIEELKQSIALSSVLMKSSKSDDTLYGYNFGCKRTNELEIEWLENFEKHLKELLLK